MEFLADELLVNILVRLPIKDIFRFKLVCKSGLRLISSSSDPYFTKNYVRNSPYTLIFHVQINLDSPNKLFYSLIEFSGKGNTHHHHIPITPPQIPDHQNNNNNISFLSFIGSCHGSAFILQRKHFANGRAVHRIYSFNPVSGSCVKLVADDKEIGETKQWQYKLGFIPSNNTCKLLRFVSGVEKAEIFTVGGLDWRKVDDYPLLFCGALNCHDNGRLVCFNGAYHWVSSSEHGDDTIFTFDLLQEKSGTRIPKPHGMSQRLSDNTTRLTILDDRLSVVELSVDKYNSTMVIWTMREYGVVESWSKLIVLTLFEKYPDRLRNCSLVPIAVLANGDILFSDMVSCGGMCFYNLQERRLTPINDDPATDLYRVYEYPYVTRFYT